jgi:hypothetical protein
MLDRVYEVGLHRDIIINACGSVVPLEGEFSQRGIIFAHINIFYIRVDERNITGPPGPCKNYI